MKIAVFADDLSGAAEVGARAQTFGFSVELTRMSPPFGDAEVWICDTATRDLDAETAAEKVREAATWIPLENPPLLFKKIDSILRGHPAVECAVLAEVLGKSQQCIAAGNPSRDRIVRDGVLTVEGIPVHQTAFAREAGFQIRTSQVEDLWKREPGFLNIPTRFLEAASLEELHARADSPSEEILYAGGVDYFDALFQTGRARGSLPESPESLWIVCGSQTGWPARQDYFEQQGWPVYHWGRFPEQAPPPIALMGFGPAPERAVCNVALAESVAVWIRNAPPEMLCLEGGATASTVFEVMGWREFSCVAEWESGVVELQIENVNIRLLIKPGSYLWPEPLFRQLPTKV